ncbi:ABC transporter substrate-binding protein [Betaproteobacteria bacterium]|nr:ABC transporter substrate-binding protein [Betaproteobacteria bacterium]
MAHSLRLLVTFLLLTSSPTKANSVCGTASNTEKVVVAGGSLTEIMYFLGLQKKIVALDVTSSFPIEAKKLPSIGYVRALSTEGVLSLEPTLVIGENDMGPENVVEQIKRTNIDLRIIPEIHSAEGIKSKVLCLGTIFDLNDKTKKKVNDELIPLIDDLEEIQEKNKKLKKRILLILSMQGTSPVVAGLGTAGDGFIKMTGASNVITEFEGWKPVSPESLILSNPDYILITSRGMRSFKSIDELVKQPALSLTNAAKNRNVVDINGMAMLGFGPRGIMTALEVARRIYGKDS